MNFIKLNTYITKIDLDKTVVYTKDDKFSADMIISTVSPDFILIIVGVNWHTLVETFIKLFYQLNKLYQMMYILFTIQMKMNNKLELLNLKNLLT